MKTLHRINLWLFIITVVLYLTVYFGMLFSMVLGFAQVIISLYILTEFNKLKKNTKILFSFYLIGTVSILTLIFTDRVTLYKDFGLLVYFIIPSILALIHLYITYLISREGNLSYEL